MKNVKLFVFFSLLSFGLCAQQKTAESTELYSPVPPVVSPGENSKPPSDAIILFEGTNFDQWESNEGSNVVWTLADGCMTIKPGAGNIKTRKMLWRLPATYRMALSDANRENGGGYQYRTRIWKQRYPASEQVRASDI